MKRFSLVRFVWLVVGISAHADLVPNGDFRMYKPGTGYTVSATFPPGNFWTTGMGDNTPVNGGEVEYGDGTTGTVVDVPGWISPVDSQGSPTATADLFTYGYDETDGSSSLNAFGAWSGQNGNLAQSSDPLTLPAGGPYTLSAMVIGDVSPRTFDLLVDGLVLPPDSSVDPSFDAGLWQEISRTYTIIPPGDVRILVGTARPGVGDPALLGTRMRVDNISLNGSPEPQAFKLVFNRANESEIDIAWPSQSNRVYRLWSSPDVSVDILNWDLAEGGIVATPPTNKVRVTPPERVLKNYYRVEEVPQALVIP